MRAHTPRETQRLSEPVGQRAGRRELSWLTQPHSTHEGCGESMGAFSWWKTKWPGVYRFSNYHRHSKEPMLSQSTHLDLQHSSATNKVEYRDRGWRQLSSFSCFCSSGMYLNLCESKQLSKWKMKSLKCVIWRGVKSSKTGPWFLLVIASYLLIVIDLNRMWSVVGRGRAVFLCHILSKSAVTT